MTSTSGPAPAASAYHEGTGFAHAAPRPQHLGLAAGCTIAVGALALLVSGFMILGAFIVMGAMGAIAPFDPSGMGGPFLTRFGAALGGIILVVALPLLVYGVITLMAGVRLNRGDPGAYSTTMVVNILSVALAVVTLFAGGAGLLHGALSGVALWALYQPDVKAFFGR